MKKRIGLVFVFLFLFCFAAANEIAAADAMITDLGKVSTYFGLNYNTYDLDKFHDLAEENTELEGGKEEIDSGFGFYLGVRQWISEDTEIEFVAENMPWSLGNAALGFEIESMGVEYDDVNVSASNTGFLATYAHRLSAFNEKIPDYFLFTFAAGLYQAKRNYIEADQTCRGPGMKMGIEGLVPLQEIISMERDVSLSGRMNYRAASPHSGGELNFSGFEFALQAEASF